MAKQKKEKEHGEDKRSDKDILEDEDLGLEELDDGEPGEDEEEDGFSKLDAGDADKSPKQPAAEKARPAQQQGKKSPGSPRVGADKGALVGLKDQLKAVHGELETQSHPKLIAALEHVQQAITWLEDFLRSK